MIKCDLCHHQGGEVVVTKFGLQYIRCGNCGHVYADVGDFDYVAENEQANASLEETHNAKHDSPRHEKAYAKVLSEFEVYRQTNRLVEIGCSSGSFLRRAVQAGWDAVGVEPVAASAEVGIRDYGLNVVVGTLGDAQFESDSADVIYSNAVIEHVDSPAELVREAARILRKGGLFYADTVNLASYTWQFLGADWKLVDPRVHLHLFDPKSLNSLCEQAGLKVDKMTTHGVRFHATRADKPTGMNRLLDELRKGPYSFAARRNLKGDNIAVYAHKQ